MPQLDDDALDFYAHHWDPRAPHEGAWREAAIEDLAVRSPIGRSDQYGGFWVVSTYAGEMAVLCDHESFSNDPVRAFFGRPADRPPMPPIDLDPPLQREYRQLLNPLLTPRVLAKFEPGIRALVTELLDGFIEDGHCDFAAQFAMPFPGRMLYKFLFGIDESEVLVVKEWTEKGLDDPFGAEGRQAQINWNNWLYELIAARRAESRREDLISTLLHGQVEGRPLTDQEIVGCLQVLILGGLGTTADSLVNAMIRLAGDRELQAALRAEPGNIGIDEFLRVDTPVPVATRRCVREVEIEGQTIKPGENVLVFTAAANRDPKAFPDPGAFDGRRDRNRHLGFGAGPHRCVGSHVARMNFRIAMEEILTRIPDFWITPGDQPRRESPQALTFSIKYLPLTFVPGVKAAR